jgi:hypothetical protein
LEVTTVSSGILNGFRAYLAARHFRSFIIDGFDKTSLLAKVALLIIMKVPETFCVFFNTIKIENYELTSNQTGPKTFPG